MAAGREEESGSREEEKKNLSVILESFQLLSYPPEVTTRNTIFHGETILTVGDGSLYWHQASLSLPCRPYPMRNREDAGRRSEDGEKLRSCKISMCASLKHFGRDTWGNNLIMH